MTICERALIWVEPKGPWLALKARLEARPARPAAQSTAAEHRAAIVMLDEPRRVTDEGRPWPASSGACSAIATGPACPRDRLAANVPSGSKANNYWYQFFLAFLEDKAGYLDEALDHYSVAAALEPESPGVRFSRARLYRSKGRWDLAIDDMRRALEKLSGQPEAAQVQLELGYLYQELGDFTTRSLPSTTRSSRTTLSAPTRGPPG